MSVEILSKSAFWRLAVSLFVLVLLLGTSTAAPASSNEYSALVEDQSKPLDAESLDDADSLLVLDRVPLELVARRLNRRRIIEGVARPSPSEIFARNSRNAAAHSDNAVAIRNLGDLPMFRFGRR